MDKIDGLRDSVNAESALCFLEAEFQSEHAVGAAAFPETPLEIIQMLERMKIQKMSSHRNYFSTIK